MLCFPNAKINLGLNVVNKRSDGYHSIETIFYPIPLRDALEVVNADTFSFIQRGISLDGLAENNLVIKAMKRLEEQYSLPLLEVCLLKAIPFGAGLGGGSSDAAFMLKLLNDFCHLNISIDQLEQMAAKIGADCPFFIRNTPVFASGIGDVFEPIELSLKGYYLCLVKPESSVSTPQAYASIRPKTPERSLKDIIQKPITEWCELMENDFEKSIFPKFPEIERIKNALYEAGAVYASMSGSGSSVFGLFQQPIDVKEKFSACYVWQGEL